jgi:F420-dependent oxidoreductase-like protein
MKVGLVLPQGWVLEYRGWEPARAWARTVELALEAERLGFDSIWLYDHFLTFPRPADELTFEAFTGVSALAALTSRIRLGHLVLCAGYRNPALVAKMIGTLDVISGGRVDLGIGAGWKQDEFLAYGYGFPSLGDRLGLLADSLEIIAAMLGPGRVTYSGEHARVDGAINLPKGLQQPRVPIMVGGNGPNVTWRLAARHADELNLDNVGPEQVPAAMAVIADRCREIGRDPASLRVSGLAPRVRSNTPGQERRDMLAAYQAAGFDRVMLMLQSAVDRDDAFERLAEDALAAGVQVGD